MIINGKEKNTDNLNYNASQYDTAQLQKDCDALGISLNKEQKDQFILYYELLIEWNRNINLTSIVEYEEVLKKHFVDSLSLIKAYPLDNSRISLIDVGTGAGFPGLPLKIAFPELQLTLLDSLEKRIRFLNHVVEKLGMENVTLIHGRAEDIAREERFREKYDICTSRAVSNLSTLTEYCLPFVKNGGLFISYKSEKGKDELANAKNAISICGGKVEKIIEFTLPETDIPRTLISIKKERATPKKYPRKAGTPSKNPL